MRPPSTRKRVKFVSRLVRLFLRGAARLKIFTRVTVKGTENVPATGAVLLAVEHLSIFDPLVVFGLLERDAAFLAAAGLFWGPFGVVMRWMGNIPVARGTDAARDTAEFGARVLEQGGLVVIFPPGKCEKREQPLRAKGGLAEMAFRTGAVVLPVTLIGTDRVKPLRGRWHFMKRVEVIIGQPMRAPYQSLEVPLADRQAFTRQVLIEIARPTGRQVA